MPFLYGITRRDRHIRSGYFFAEHIFTFVWNPAAYEPYSIEQISRVLQYGILFLFSSFIFFIIIVGLAFRACFFGRRGYGRIVRHLFFIKQKIAPKDYYPLALILFFIFAQIFRRSLAFSV